MQVRERRQHLDHVGDRLVDREGRVGAAPLLAALPDQVVQGRPADVLHDDVRRAVGGGDEVVDLDDQRVLDLGQVLLLGHGGARGVGIAGVEQALQHDPAAVDVAVAGQVDPPHPAVGEAAGDLVLAADEHPGLQARVEVEGRAALRAEALGSTGLVAAGATDRGLAGGAVALALGDDGRVHQRGGRVQGGHRRHGDHPGAQARRPGAADAEALRAPAAAGRALRAERHGAEAGAGDATARCAHRQRVGAGARRRRWVGRARRHRRSGGGHAAHVAVAVEDLAGAARLRAAHHVADRNHQFTPCIIWLIVRTYSSTCASASARSHGAAHSRSRAAT